MNTTTNYNLKMPSGSDYFNIEDFNENMRTIDTNLANASSSADVISEIETAKMHIESQLRSKMESDTAAILGAVNNTDTHVTSGFSNSATQIQNIQSQATTNKNDILTRIGNESYLITAAITSVGNNLSSAITQTRIQLSSEINEKYRLLLNEILYNRDEILYNRDEYLSGKNEILRALNRLEEKIETSNLTEISQHAMYASLNSCVVKTVPGTYEEDE